MSISFQLYSLSERGELRREELCAQVEKRHLSVQGMISGAKGNVTMVECNRGPKQKWAYEVSFYETMHVTPSTSLYFLNGIFSGIEEFGPLILDSILHFNRVTSLMNLKLLRD